MNITHEEKNLLQSYFGTKPIIRAFLFGSMARDEADLGSNLDIIVEHDHSNPIGMKFFSYQPDLEEQKVDLISANGISPFIKPYIDEDKILIYKM